MKTKLLLAIVTIFTLTNSFAQTTLPKGSVLLGGSIGFSSNKFESDPQDSRSYNNFTISPSVGIAVKNNLFIGATVGVGFSKNKGYYNTGGSLDSTKTHSYNYGIFVRKYVPLKNNFSIFLQGDLSGNNSTEKSDSKDLTIQYSSKGFGVGASLSPGISYAINSKLQIETGLNGIVGVGYSQNKIHSNTFTPGSTKSTNFNAYTSLNNFSSSLYFGFRLLLQKKDRMVASSK